MGPTAVGGLEPRLPHRWNRHWWRVLLKPTALEVVDEFIGKMKLGCLQP